MPDATGGDDASTVTPGDGSTPGDATVADVASSDAPTALGDAGSTVDATGPIDATPDAAPAIDAGMACPGEVVDAGITVSDAAVGHVVTSGADSGTGSLRAAIAASASGDLITFASSVTRVQLASEIDIAIPLTIQGPGASSLTIDGGGSSTAIHIAASNVTLAGFTVTNAGVGIHVAQGSPVFTQGLLVTHNATYGLEVTASGSTNIARDTGSTFTGNGTGVITHVLQSTGTAAAYLTSSTIIGNQIGVAVVTDTQIAQIDLQGCTTIAANTMYGALVQIAGDAGTGFPSLVAPATGGAGTNLITQNPVGVQRLGGASDGDLTFAPLAQVTGNTTDFVPAFP
jgi:hypothetical protein